MMMPQLAVFDSSERALVNRHVQSNLWCGLAICNAASTRLNAVRQAALEAKSEKLRYLYSPTHAEGNDDGEKGVVYKR